MVENIITSSLVFACFLTLLLTVYYFFNMRGMKARKAYFEQLHLNIKPGKKIVFCNGIYGKILKVNKDMVEVALLDGTRMEINRYVISEIVD